MSIKICPSCYYLLLLLVHSRKCDTNDCIGILAFEGQSKGLLVMKSYCILYEVLRHHMHQFLLGRLVGWYPYLEVYFGIQYCIALCNPIAHGCPVEMINQQYIGRAGSGNKSHTALVGMV